MKSVFLLQVRLGMKRTIRTWFMPPSGHDFAIHIAAYANMYLVDIGDFDDLPDLEDSN